MKANAVFTYSTYIDTTPEKLWEALTSPEFTAKYWGGRTMYSDWKEGSEIRIVQPKGREAAESRGKVLKSEFAKLLVYQDNCDDPSSASTLTFEIVSTPAQVRLNVTHEVSMSELPPMVREGWYAIAASLKTLLETGKPLDYSWWRG
jgi:uncharacterized protein YndB with AHSA1/START domain